MICSSKYLPEEVENEIGTSGKKESTLRVFSRKRIRIYEKEKDV